MIVRVKRLEQIDAVLNGSDATHLAHRVHCQLRITDVNSANTGVGRHDRTDGAAAR